MLHFLLFSALLIIFDFITKHLAYTFLAGGKIMVIIPGILRLLYLKNTGAAFGILRGNQFFLISISLLVAVYIFYYVRHECPVNRMQLTGLTFLFGGTVGNLLNRIFTGGVIDFFDLYNRWPVFNFADIFINVGVALVIISILRDSYHKKK
jgi:signal peptidase II